MKILLFGKGGQVGCALQCSLAPLGTLTTLDHDSRELCGDFTNPESLAETVRKIAPDVIVNAAAYTAVDQAESEPELAHTINAEAPAVLAREAKRLDAWLVHYSTDYVYDGSGETPWLENDTPHPLNVYGQTKLKGDEAIRASSRNHLIFRTSWVYAAEGQNFITTILRLAREKQKLKIVNDQIGAPTGAELIANITAHALRIALQKPGVSGLYHLAAGGETSWYEYARFILECTQKLGGEFALTPEAILPTPSSQYPTPAKRPHNSRLDTTKLKTTFGVVLPDWQTDVTTTLTQVFQIRAAA